MPQGSNKAGQRVLLPKAALRDLVAALRGEGYTVVAPVRIDGATISLRPIESGDEIARGLRDEQNGGHYRLVESDPEMYFQYVVGPDSPKRYLFPPVQRLFKLRINGERFAMDAGPPQAPRLALLGIRPCEFAAMRVQDRVFGGNGFVGHGGGDPFYQQARRDAFVIVVNCTRPGGTCFCVSMGTGPKATDGFDLSITELRGGFVIEIGSQRGAALVAKLPVREPSPAEIELAGLLMERAREHMGRVMDNSDVKQLLDQSLEHPRWNEVAKRCLSCGNCTMVCPTCFCCTTTDSTDLSGKELTRTRQWESCFTHQFSYAGAGPVRNTIRGRYRHWLRHKLGTWWDQFDCSGCVGCGRCITWCPVGIDLTEEIRAIRGSKEGAS